MQNPSPPLQPGTVGTVYHSLGLVWTQMSGGLHGAHDIKYCERTGHACYLFAHDSMLALACAKVPPKIVIYTVAEPWRLRGGSEWVWDWTVVIDNHNLTSQS